MRQPLKPWSYRSLRCVQISTVFFVTLIIQEWVRYPRAGWTGFAVMMIYAGFDNGTTMLRAFHRYLGMIMGLSTGYVCWFMGHLDYRVLIMLLPMSVFFAYFYAGRIYSIPTIFMVNCSVIGLGFFNMDPTSTVTYYVEDYSLCTTVAFAIILIFEYFWFRRHKMMRRFIIDTQAEVLQDLHALVTLLNQGKVRNTEWFNKCLKLARSLNQVTELIQNKQFIARIENLVKDDFVAFVENTNHIFIGLKALYMAYYTPRYHKFDYFHLFHQVKREIVQLKTFIVDEHHLLEITLGEMYATPH